MSKDDSIIVEAELVTEDAAKSVAPPWRVIFRNGRGYLVGLIIGAVASTLLAFGITLSIARILHPESPSLGFAPEECIWLFWAIPFLSMTMGVVMGNRRLEKRQTGVSGEREILAASGGMLRRVMIFQLINAVVGILGFAFFYWIVSGVTVFAVARGLRFSVFTQMLLNVGIGILAFPEWTLLAMSLEKLSWSFVIVVKIVALAVACVSLSALSRAVR
ncbi:MAG: hypothetical protein P1U87_20460 [Verrucomicrobiales bacterium]|nr:hypothetical protein [Verrucomicrobiales bacterium]